VNEVEVMFLFLTVGTISLFSSMAVALWAAERRREREAYYKSETIRKIAETQGAGGDVALEYMRELDRSAWRRRREGHKLAGLITLAVGISLILFIGAVERPDARDTYLVGLIPLFIGLALLLYAYLLAPKE